MTQKEMVLRYIEDFGSITSLDAFRDLGVTRLAEIIRRLKEDQHDIIAETEEGKNRYGHVTRYARYRFRE